VETGPANIRGIKVIGLPKGSLFAPMYGSLQQDVVWGELDQVERGTRRARFGPSRALDHASLKAFYHPDTQARPGRMPGNSHPKYLD